jgi:hypothetical protein
LLINTSSVSPRPVIDWGKDYQGVLKDSIVLRHLSLIPKAPPLARVLNPLLA